MTAVLLRNWYFLACTSTRGTTVHTSVTPGGGPPGRSQNLQGRDSEVHGVLALGHDHQAEHRHSRAGIKGLVQ